MPQECGSLFIQINEWLAAVHDYFVFALELWCYHKVYANHKKMCSHFVLHGAYSVALIFLFVSEKQNWSICPA